MLKMRLPVRTAEEPGDEQHRTGSALRAASGSSSRLAYPLHLDKETVFQWFGLHLNPAKRIELMCGLLHMCQPLELRFLGSCLEDLARKDFHVLRDFETKANSPRELGLLADVGDPVVRSKLLVCLSLLGSDNRRCAGILFRTLGRVDPPAQWQKHRCRSPRCSRLPLLVADDGLLQQLALLFTMASLHPAFPFHQRENVRLQLEKVELAVREEERRRRLGADSPATEPCLGDKIPQADDFSCRTDVGQNSKRQCQHLSQSPDKKCQREAVYIEKILLKGISWSRSDKEYCFELKWSNSTSSTAIKTHHELENFLLKLPKEFATESFEKSILRLLSQGDKYECWELEQTLKEKFLSAPPAFRQTRTVSGFFLSSPGSSCSHYLDKYIIGHRKKPGSKSPSLSTQSRKSCSTDSRRAAPSDLNRMSEWRRKSCLLKPALEQQSLGPEQHPAGEKWSATPSTKTKPRASVTNKDKEEPGENRLGCVSNGFAKLSPMLPPLQYARKDTLQDSGSCQDSYGETSSESYSSPSSPQHDGQESLDSEDEKDKDTDSHSDDYSKSRVENFPSCKRMTGAAFTTLNTLVASKLKEEPSHLKDPLCNSAFPKLSFVHPLPYLVQNGVVALEPGSVSHGPDGEPAVRIIGVGAVPSGHRENVSCTVLSGEVEKLPTEPATLSYAFGPPLAGLQQATGPSLQARNQHFKSPSLQGSSETYELTQQPPVGSAGIVPQGPSFMSALPQTYPNTEPTLGSGLPHPHTKPPSLSLSTGLATSYSLPVPTSVMPSVGAVATPAVSQVQVVSPVIPTHTPGPAPSSSPALTHSTAQSDSTSSGTCQPPQQMGCGTCGCCGSCGSNHAPNYYFPPHMPRQVLSMHHVFHLTSLPHQSNGTTQLPFFPRSPYGGGPLLHSHSDHVLSTQVGYGVQHVATFNHFYQPVFPLVGMMPGNTTGAGTKNGSNISCYNCGLSGHYAQDCKRPSTDATQQGGFRLKYIGARSSEAIDKAD